MKNLFFTLILYCLSCYTLIGQTVALPADEIRLGVGIGNMYELDGFLDRKFQFDYLVVRKKRTFYNFGLTYGHFYSNETIVGAVSTILNERRRSMMQVKANYLIKATPENNTKFNIYAGFGLSMSYFNMRRREETRTVLAPPAILKDNFDRQFLGLNLILQAAYFFDYTNGILLNATYTFHTLKNGNESLVSFQYVRRLREHY